LIITKVEATPVSIPLKKPFVISLGVMKTLDHVIVRLYTDSDVVGLGEAAPVPIFCEESYEDAKIVIDKYLAPAIIGEDLFNLERITERMDMAIKGHKYAKAAIDLAIWDAMGKALDVPAFQLLGGLYREKIPIVWIIGVGKQEEMAAEAKQYIKKGFSNIKVKIGMNPKEDIQNVEAIRSAIGENPTIRVDANQGYSAATAIKTLRQMEKYDLELIEQPVPGWDFDGMSKIAAALDTPVMADESLFSPKDALRLVQMRAAEIFNIKIMKPGGLYASKKIAHIAESAGIPCLVGSMIEMGIGTAACVHFACSTRIVQYPSELIGTAMLTDDILKEPYVASNGFLKVPKKPGFGVELDEEKLEKYKVI
jgi:muconate/chloromuconate cycloisomerase